MAPAGKRISKLRVLFLLLVVALIFSGFYFSYQTVAQRSTASARPWFASYVDVTATPTFYFESSEIASTEDGKAAKPHDTVLSFIVSHKNNACTPSWGSFYSLEEAGAVLDLDRRIARLRAEGGQIAISFGGALNHELAVNCTDDSKLLEAYQAVIDRYRVNTIDLDIEGEALNDSASIDRRSKIIALLQNGRPSKARLAVWLTLPATTEGLTEQGVKAVTSMLDAGVDLSGVNLMTMNFGQSKEAEETMGQASIRALTNAHRQLDYIYDSVGNRLNSGTIWSKLGATPMIGQNDTREEVFSLEDAKTLNSFVKEHGISRTSMWSANRDRMCGSNYTSWSIVSDSCSGFDQGESSFSTLLADGLLGNLSSASGVVTPPEEPKPPVFEDDPETSPYPIWNENSSYIAGSKVVWLGNVYEAKWWTRGELPNNPVLNTWETPWRLIGPVLEGETPVVPPKLPDGTYPKWSGKKVYIAGDRVIFEDRAYQAKWWNEGSSPAVSHADPESSPWVALSYTQIRKILEELESENS